MRKIVLATIVVFAVSVPFAAQALAPAAVSPGGPNEVLVSATACPLFSWSGTAGTDGYELTVVDSVTSEVVLEALIPGGARGWSPGAGECLERGATYAWSVRAASDEGPGPWAEPLLFEVAAVPNEDAVREAAEVLRAWLAAAEGVAVDDTSVAPGPSTSRLVIDPDITAVSAFFETGLGLLDVTVGVHGLSHSTTPGSAGAMGVARSATGNVAGVLGQGSPAGAFHNTGGGMILEARLSGKIPPVQVAGDGDVFAEAFTGKGTGLTGVRSVTCTECVDGTDIVDGTITSQDLQSESVGQAKISNNAVDTIHLTDDAVGTDEIAAGAVLAVKIAADSIGRSPTGISHFAEGAVGSSDIASGAVTTVQIALHAVTRSKLQGSERILRAIHPDCPSSGKATFQTQCTSSVCALSPTTFLDCNGNCSKSVPETCSNPHEGWLLSSTMDP